MGQGVYRNIPKMKSIKKCEICGSRNISHIFKQYDKNLNIKECFSVFKCANCYSLFLNPQPTEKDLEKYYSKDKYYSLKRIDTKESRKTKLKLKLYDIYFNPKENKTLIKIMFSPIKFIIRGTKIVKDNKLLDIGCGSGQFLYEMRQFEMNTYGIEPGDFDKEGNKKYDLNIKKSNLLKTKYPKEYFDLITMNHVLEHLDNPNQTLMEIKRIIKKDGLFIFAVPNINSLAHKIFKKNWYQLDIPRHLWNYSDKNIKIILEKNGFNIQRIRYNSRPSQFSVSLKYLLNVKSRRIEQILNVLLLPLTWLVNLFRIGDQIEVWCQKNKN